jgi:hypothetical protein
MGVRLPLFLPNGALICDMLPLDLQNKINRAFDPLSALEPFPVCLDLVTRESFLKTAPLIEQQNLPS